MSTQSMCHEASEITRTLAEILNDAQLSEVHYEKGDLRIHLIKHAMAPQPLAPVVSSVPIAAPTATAAEVMQAGEAVTSPLVGTAYLAPKEGAEPFVKVGDTVQAGQTLLIIEAMKIMNAIKAPCSGVVIAISARNGVPVEFGEELVRIKS